MSLSFSILVYIIDQDVHAATGTSLAIAGGSALLGAFAHSRKGDVRIKRSLAFGLMSMIGALPGVLLNRLVAGKVLLILFGFLMIAVASISGFVGHLSYGNVNLTIVGLFVLSGLGASYPVRHCQVEYQNRSFPKRLAGSPSSSPCS